MKVGLIYPRNLNLVFPPLGVLYIAGFLREAGHKVIVCDTDKEGAPEMLKRIKEFCPQVVGISIINTTQISFARGLIKEIKEILPFARIVCGGIYSTVFATSLIETSGIDVVVRGEGEMSMLEVVNAIEKGCCLEAVNGVTFRNNGSVVETEQREMIADLDALPFPARDLVDFEQYLRPPGVLRGIWFKRSTTIITGRGCPAQCIYCGSNLLFGRRLRRRSVSNVLSEIKELIANYRIDGIWFADDTFTLDAGWVLEFTKQIKEENINIRWGCQARVNTVNYEMLKAMKEAGCLQLDFGVESGSPRVLKALQKGTTPESAIRAFDLARKVGIRSLATFMVGNPEEKKEDIDLTRKLAERIKANFTIFFFTTPYPGTKLFNMAIENNWLKNRDYDKWFVRTPSAMEIYFSKRQLIRIRAQLQNRFIFRNTFSTLRNLEFLISLVVFSVFNLPALIKALAVFMESHSFDDFVFNFVEESKK